MEVAASLRATAGAADLERLQRFVEESAAGLGAEAGVVADIAMAFDEALANVVRHGYGGRAGPVEVEVGQDGADLLVRLRDEAPPFDPTALPTPDPEPPFFERPPGGLGTYFLREYCDQIVYRRTAEGWNELTLVRRDAL